MLKRPVFRVAIAAFLFGVTEVVLASSASTYFPVSVSVSRSCSISTVSALAFVAYDPIGANATAASNATGQISVACSKSATGMTIGMDSGTHLHGTERHMMGSTAVSTLQYNIFQPPNNSPGTACTFPGTIAWTATGAGLFSITSAASNAARVYNVCGSIPGGQNVTADTYTDTVGATINF